MLPSRAGSAPTGNGSASGTVNTGHGSAIIGTRIRPGLVGSGLIEVTAGASSNTSGVGRPVDGSEMLGGNGAGVGSRGGVRPGNGTGLTTLQVTGPAGGIGGMNTGIGVHGGGRFDPDRQSAHPYSGSDVDSDSGDDDDPVGSAGDTRRGVKRERAEMEAAAVGPEVGVPPGGYGGVPGGVAGAKPGKKTRGRVKIKMEFIDNKLRRYTTFSKRKTGIMKKAYELSTLTGTQVLLLVASETGHVYTFATRKLQPMITSETGKALIQTCLNSPDSPPRSDPTTDQRMSATGFEETDLTYQVSESDSCGETKDMLKPTFTVASLPGTTSTQPTAATTATAAMQANSSPSFPLTTCWPVSACANTNSITSANGTVLKTAGTSGSVMQLPGGFTFMSGGGMAQQLQAIQVHPTTQPSSVNTSDSPEISQASTSSTVSVPATIVTSSVPTSMAGHMMYPSPHAVMYASTPTLADGGLAVLNAFTQAPPAMQVSHAPGQDTGAVPQVFLTGPPGTVQIPVSAVQLHPMVIGQQSSGSSSNLTELQVVNLDAPHNAKND
ncbi:serum response factor-like isoform X2 [Megalops cyprinoides]|uniref:serum response factor-like isoform X2 n=1 Tax=Megalops cyprinoides TaxID=118141 RepID=UPI001864C25A|nr:serum response factor-like isoform X2 [Megalops cyprinoides]